MLERVSEFVASEQAEVRRYTQRFLHGKAYALGTLNDGGGLTGPGAALVSSANLTYGGLSGNLELGMVHYQPNVVAMTLGWHRRLWEQADDFCDELLELLQPPPLKATPDDVFLRALIELYGDEPEPDRYADELTAFQRDGAARARAIMERYGGVLYADGVGMGKTEIAIDFIREHVEEHGHHVLVIASAQLRDSMWEPRLESANLAARVVSYQQLAQDAQLGGTDPVLRLPIDAYKLVVVDEADAYRNSDTSWYAALQTARRMRQKVLARVEYLRQATDADIEFDDEVLGEIEGLADELIAEPGDWSDPDGYRPDLLDDLQKDSEILGEMAEQIEQLDDWPDPKLDQLQEVMATTAAQKVAIFTSFQDTAEYLKQAIDDDPGLLKGRTWAAVIGAGASEAERERAINRFCPELAEGVFDPEKHGGVIDVLLSTDILSEGQNLQQAQAVLSYDMPWNPQRVVQRNGRVIRLRSHHDIVFLYTLMPQDDELEELLRLEAALQAKIKAANASMGMETPVLAGEASVQRIYEGIKEFADRLRTNDASLLDEDR